MIAIFSLVALLIILPLFRLSKNWHYSLSVFILAFNLLFVGGWVSKVLFLLLIALYYFCYIGQHLLFIEQYLWPFAKKRAPKIAPFEKEALKAGEQSLESVFFDPCDSQIKKAIKELKKAQNPLTQREKDFLDNTVQELLEMCDDFTINHKEYDLPKEVWEFLKKERFFGLMIPEEHGGLGLTQQAHSKILSKIASKSLTLASIVAVPNSLGPAELLLHYGTEKQKDSYLRALAQGEQIPCFGLTSMKAGSDAQSLEDYATVVRLEENGVGSLFLKVNFSKRYITLAPIATVMGLAVKIYDPDLLYFDKEDVGMSVLILPTTLDGIKKGGRHYPSSLAFLNGPISGQDVLVPLESIIGGARKAGQGWAMLVECLTCGRAISLPSIAIGSAYSGLIEAVLYSQLRVQFSRPIGSFEAVSYRLFEALMWTTCLDSMKTATISLIDAGKKPGVLSGAVKYFTTENARSIACHIIDVMAGKAVMMGPSNTVIASYHGAPVGITVEGANILTRSLMVFGQGVFRSHRYLSQVALSLDSDDKHSFSLQVWQWLQSSYLLFFQVLFSPFRGLFSKKDHFLVSMSTRYRLLTDLSLAYYAGSLKKKGQLCGFMADLLCLQFTYLTVLAQSKEPKKAKLAFLRYHTLKVYKELIEHLPCFLRYCMKILDVFAPLSGRYPEKEMRVALEQFSLDIVEGQEGFFETIDRSHGSINKMRSTYKVLLSHHSQIKQYWERKQKKPFLSYEEICQECHFSDENKTAVYDYLQILEEVLQVDVFVNLQKKELLGTKKEG